MKAPFRYYGGKGNFAARLAPLIPHTQTYVETHGGAASMLFRRRPSPVEVYNDIDGQLVNFFRVLQNREQQRELLRRLKLTLYSRQEWRRAHRITRDGSDDPIEMAWAHFVLFNQGFGGSNDSWGYVINQSNRGMAETTSKYLNKIRYLPKYRERMRGVQIEEKNSIDIISFYDGIDTTFYIDPPYPLSSRNDENRGRYRNEMSDEQHIALVESIKGIKGNVVVSTYENPIYEQLENAGFKKMEFATASYAAGRTRATGIQGKGAALEKQPRTEIVYSRCRHNQGDLFG